MLELTYKRILLIALPLMFGTFVQSMIIITDGAFVSELGNTSYNAVGNGGLIYVALFMLCRGLADGTQISIAKKYGEGKNSDIGKLLINAQFLQLLLSAIIFIFFFFFSEMIINSIVKSREIGDAMIDFIKYRSWGIFFAGLYISMAALFIGVGKTKIIIFSTILLAGTNILLDYGLIFGELGFPKLGMIGAPIASSISEAVAFIFMLVIAIYGKPYKEFKYSLKLKIQRVIYNPLLRLSFPLMLQGLVSLSTWLIFFSMIEHMGSRNLEVAHNIRYMYFLAFIPIFGFAAATRTYVSNLVGRRAHDQIPKIQLKIIILSAISIVLVFHGSFFYPEYLIKIVEHNPNIDPGIMQDSANALRFVSGSILIYAIIIVPFNSVSALGKTTASFLIEFISIIVYLIGCYLFIEKWQWDIVHIWWIEYLYFGSLGIFSTVYLLYYRNKQSQLANEELL